MREGRREEELAGLQQPLLSDGERMKGRKEGDNGIRSIGKGNADHKVTRTEASLH